MNDETSHSPENPGDNADYSIWSEAIAVIQEEFEWIDKYREQAVYSPLLQYLERLRGSITRIQHDFVKARNSEIDGAIYTFPAAFSGAVLGPGSNSFYTYRLDDVQKDLNYTLKALEHFHEINIFMAIDPTAHSSEHETESTSSHPEPDHDQVESGFSQVIRTMKRLADIAVPQRFCMISEIMRAWTGISADGFDRRTAFGREYASSLCREDYHSSYSMTDMRNSLSHSFAYSLNHKATVGRVYRYCREIFPTHRQQLYQILNQIIEAYPYLVRKRIAVVCKEHIEDRFKPKVKTFSEILAGMPDEEVFVPVEPTVSNPDDDPVHDDVPEAEQSSAIEPLSFAMACQRLREIDDCMWEIEARQRSNTDEDWEEIYNLQRTIRTLCHVSGPRSRRRGSC